MTKIEIGCILVSLYLIFSFSYYLKKGTIKTLGFKLAGKEARRLCIIGIFVGFMGVFLTLFPYIF